MRIWKSILRFFGLSDDARVHISAPGIDVVLTGDADQVRNLLGVIRQELERGAMQSPRAIAASPRRKRPLPNRDSQVVLPSELDEWDSPYALPEAAALAAPGDVEATEDEVHTPPPDRVVKLPPAPVRAPSQDFSPRNESTAQGSLSGAAELATLLPGDDVRYTPDPADDEPPDGEVTAVTYPPREESVRQNPVVQTPGEDGEQTYDSNVDRIHDTDY